MKFPTREQTSAGGVIFRRENDQVQIAIVCVGDQRWQLPKGLVEAGERLEQAAVREVREETGIEGEWLAPIETIDYWYVATERGGRVRFHKFVHYFLLRYRSGDVGAHDHEVIEARWVPLDDARTMLTFTNERLVVEQAEAMIAAA
jgi:8-oxo-dGTP pyrophosphatase MutT (NUDIX family)